MADMAHLGWISCTSQLVFLKLTSEKFFVAHFVFVWVKTFRKVKSQLCCNSEGLGQTHMLENLLYTIIRAIHVCYDINMLALVHFHISIRTSISYFAIRIPPKLIYLPKHLPDTTGNPSKVNIKYKGAKRRGSVSPPLYI